MGIPIFGLPNASAIYMQEMYLPYMKQPYCHGQLKAVAWWIYVDA